MKNAGILMQKVTTVIQQFCSNSQMFCSLLQDFGNTHNSVGICKGPLGRACSCGKAHVYIVIYSRPVWSPPRSVALCKTLAARRAVVL